MKAKNIRKTIFSVISWSLMLSLLLSISTLTSFAKDKIIDLDEMIDLNEFISFNEKNDSPQYTDDKVLVILANTPKTQSMKFYSLYSDDYVSINEEANSIQAYRGKDTVKIAESTKIIKDELNLGIEFSEMKMFHSSQEESINGQYVLNDNNNIFSITLKNTTVEDALKILNANPDIEIAEPNYLYELDKFPNDSVFGPNKDKNNWYGLSYIKAPDAWDYTTGSQSVVVGIVDSGIDGTHPDLKGNLWTNPYKAPGIPYCTKCNYGDDSHGYNFTGVGSNTGSPCGGIPTDENGHGTHVAGIVGAKGNNTEGISGVNWDC